MVDFDLLLGYTCENSNSDEVRSLTTCNISPIKFGAILCPLIALCLFKALLFLDQTHIEKYSSYFYINKTNVPSRLYPILNVCIMASPLLGQSMTVQVHDIFPTKELTSCLHILQITSHGSPVPEYVTGLAFPKLPTKRSLTASYP